LECHEAPEQSQARRKSPRTKSISLEQSPSTIRIGHGPAPDIGHRGCRALGWALGIGGRGQVGQGLLPDARCRVPA
jgi:hypothetical protein